jgi:Alpha-N-acetylglucosaminidase (NAGLU) C-terminal domain
VELKYEQWITNFTLLISIYDAARYDLVDLTRQALSKLANQVYLDALTAYGMNNLNTLNLHSKKFLGIIKDLDTLLASDDNFLLGTWLKDAKSLAMTSSERKQVRHSYFNLQYRNFEFWIANGFF